MLRRSLFVLVLITLLQPFPCMAQNPPPPPPPPSPSSPPPALPPVPIDVSSEAKRKAEEEARQKAMAEEMQKRKAEEERKKKSLIDIKPESGAGFQLLKIPVTGIYYLGMRQREYDSLVQQLPLFISTEKDRYAVKPSPYFMHGRLYHLILTLPDSIFSSDMTDLTQYYQSKLGITDEQWISDTSMLYPSEIDSSLQGTYRVKQARLTWHFNNHDVRLWYNLTDMKNGQWKGSYLVSYSGNGSYIGNLRSLEEKEKKTLGGY